MYYIQAKEDGHKAIVCSSGGNAGLAAAYSARMLGLTAIIIVPKSTPKSVVDKLKDENAEVIVHGNNWCEADQKARQKVESGGNVIHFTYVVIFSK